MPDLTDLAWIRISFVDVLGASHALDVPAARFQEAVDTGIVFDGSALEGHARHLETDMLLRADPATLVPLADGVARAVGSVVTPSGDAWPGDPRTTLVRLVEDLGDLGKEWTAAAELEFYLLDAGGAPLDAGGYFGDNDGRGPAIARAAADDLTRVGIPVGHCHHEAGPGQYEIDIEALGAVALADALVITKQAIRDAAGGAGLRATFMARPINGEAGSGLHLHQRAGTVFVNRGTLTEEGCRLVAGQLHHARGLCALGAPTVNSYKRLHAGPEAPGAAVWAHVNRAALVRVSTAVSTHASVEYRGADPSANPYLLVAGLLAAGADGLDQELDPGPPLEEDVAGVDPASTTIRFDPLPRTLDEALDALAEDDVLTDALGGQLVGRFIDGRRAEAEEYRSYVTGWERTRYLEEA